MIQIDGKRLGREYEPYVIAELSANHGGSIARAKASIFAAKNAGASAVKIQTYTPDTMTIDCDKEDFQIKSGLWEGYNLYKLYSEAYTPFEWHNDLFNYAREVGITLFSTPFDESAVDLLESLNTPAYKVASFELTDLPLIEYVAKKKKPILVSTGMGSAEEIAEALQAIKRCGNDQILLFHCISSYPAPTEESNLNNLKYLSNEFDVLVGLSDHSISNVAATAAIALGAVAIEKHFKLDEEDCGPDSSFSILPSEVSQLVEACSQAWLSLGTGFFTRSEVETSNAKFRRSLYFVKDLAVGDVVSKNDIRRIRPGFGLPPKFNDAVLGKRLLRSVQRGDPVRWECFKEE